MDEKFFENQQPPDGGSGSNSSSSVNYSAATSITSATAQSNQTYTSSTADQNSVLVSLASGTATLTNPTVEKSGDSDGGDNCNFYGINSAVMAMGGGAGADSLWGGKGNDTLYGGDDNDTFIFHAGEGNDVIADYTEGDMLQIMNKRGTVYVDVKKATFKNDTLTLKVTGGGKVTLNDVSSTTLVNINGTSQTVSDWVG